MNDYPQAIVPVNHVEPVPRRLRAVLAGRTVFDTTNAMYVWEWPYYPRYYIPVADVEMSLLVDEGRDESLHAGTARHHALQVDDVTRPEAVQVYGADAADGLAGTARFEWSALDAWYEEDEQVFVHARSPFTRVDALRSTRHVRIELEGVLLAESASPVMVFETGLPTRYYLNPTEVDFTHLVASDTVSECPYKGTTTGYWSVRIGDVVHADLAWTYDFPTRQLLPITGLVAFYNERVDIVVDGVPVDRPVTHFS